MYIYMFVCEHVVLGKCLPCSVVFFYGVAPQKSKNIFILSDSDAIIYKPLPVIVASILTHILHVWYVYLHLFTMKNNQL